MNIREQNEIHYLMRFFTQSQTDQWKQVPDEFPEIIFDVGTYYTKTKEPIEFLSLVLVNLTENAGGYFDNENLAEVLFESYVLLNDFMLESNRDIIFTKRNEPEQLDYIWKTFIRICEQSLKFESLTRFDITGIDLNYFVGKYGIIE
jgi:hypothetical protein